MADINETPDNEYLIDLYDEDGNKTVFEHLDTVMCKGGEYMIFIPYNDEESDVDEIVIFKTEPDGNGESALMQVVDAETLSDVYEVFKERNADKFDFED